MTNIVLTAITVIISTNVVEVEEVGRGNVKFCTNIISESHAYEVNGHQFFHVMPPATNIVRMELKWVEAPPAAIKARSMPPPSEPAAITMSGCVTRLWDGRTYFDAGDTNNNDTLRAVSKSPPMVLNRVNWELGKPLTADEAVRLCLPPLPGYVQAMTKNPK